MNSPIKVLILEDMKTDLELLKRQLLKAYPASVLTVANDRSSFFEKIDWLRPDIVLADYKLPDINGLEALLFIREKMPDVPFIFVTGSLNNEESAANAILQGANGYLLKENLSKLPAVMKSVLDENKKRLAEKEAKDKLIRQNLLTIEKIHAKLIQSVKDDSLGDITNLLGEVKENLYQVIN